MASQSTPRNSGCLPALARQISTLFQLIGFLTTAWFVARYLGSDEDRCGHVAEPQLLRNIQKGCFRVCRRKRAASLRAPCFQPSHDAYVSQALLSFPAAALQVSSPLLRHRLPGASWLLACPSLGL